MINVNIMGNNKKKKEKSSEVVKPFVSVYTHI